MSLMAVLAQATETTTKAAATGDGKSLLSYLNDGGITGYALLALSVAAISMWIYLFMILRQSRQAPQSDIDLLTRMLKDGAIPDAIRHCENPENGNFLTRMMGGALRRCSRSQLGLLELRSAMEESGQREVERLYRVVDWVAVIAAVGPMLGLLGTVFGMIGAFGSISQLEGAARSKELANYMSLALVTTALGLIVAIPCTVVFSISRRKIDEIAERIGDISEGLAAELSTRLTGPAQRPVPQRPQARPANEVRQA
jgi:biopolymer transport protein ExbB